MERFIYEAALYFYMPEQGKLIFMILTIFGIGVLFAVICLYLGYTQYSFPMTYLSMFIFLVLGMMLFSSGLELEDTIRQTSPGVWTTTYVVHTTVNDPVVNVVANTFFYIPFAGLLLSVFFALRGWR
jgi:uncharacterized membrane protein